MSHCGVISGTTNDHQVCTSQIVLIPYMKDVLLFVSNKYDPSFGLLAFDLSCMIIEDVDIVYNQFVRKPKRYIRVYEF